LQKDNEEKNQKYAELSAVWQELLGRQSGKAATPASSQEEVAIPTLESDPWSRLLHAKGIEIVDLEQLHLHMSEQDVEHLLEIMREQPAQNIQANDDQAPD
jgi:predicted nucleic acid-binding Zn ribbon protein